MLEKPKLEPRRGIDDEHRHRLVDDERRARHASIGTIRDWHAVGPDDERLHAGLCWLPCHEAGVSVRRRSAAGVVGAIRSQDSARLRMAVATREDDRQCPVRRRPLCLDGDLHLLVAPRHPGQVGGDDRERSIRRPAIRPRAAHGNRKERDATGRGDPRRMLPGRARRDHAVTGDRDRGIPIGFAEQQFLNRIADPAGVRPDGHRLDRLGAGTARLERCEVAGGREG